MWRNLYVAVRTGLVFFSLAVTAGFPLAALADSIPASVAALLPTGAKLGGGDWAIFETDFGKTFVGGLQAASFPGQRPSCPFSGTPELKIELTGDTAFENPPMLDMMVADFDKGVSGAPAAISKFISTYIANNSDVVSVGPVHDETRPDGYVVYIEYIENCSSRPNSPKTRLKAFARRGATQVELNMVLALDGAATAAIAGEVLQNFAKLDITALTQ